jgi:hypothetical protein
MGPLYVASVLMSITSNGQSPKVAEAELEPIVPGAWAAWAKDWDEQRAALTAGLEAGQKTPSPTFQTAGSKA